MTKQASKIIVQNINVPTYRGRVDREKYEATKLALLQILPSDGAGITQAEMMAQVSQVIDQRLFPQGLKSGWWTKTVQLDLEAKGILTRHHTKPLRWSKI